MSFVVLDTSVVIGLTRETVEMAIDPTATPAISAVTYAELQHGMLAAPPEQLAFRITAVRYVQEHCQILPVDERVAEMFGRIAADARRIRGRRIATPDGLIAATAAVHRIPLYTKDHDFADLPGVEVVLL